MCARERFCASAAKSAHTPKGPTETGGIKQGGAGGDKTRWGRGGKGHDRVKARQVKASQGRTGQGRIL